MRVVKDTILHVFVHIALFTALALLIPVVSARINKEASWVANANTLTASILLIIICVVMMYKIKQSTIGVFKSLGGMMFLPGFLAVFFGIFSAEKIVTSIQNITGAAIVQPVADFYIRHSIPSVLSVAAVYMAVGGAIYWIGNLLDRNTRSN